MYVEEKLNYLFYNLILFSLYNLFGMIKKLFLLFVSLASATFSFAQLSIQSLLVENKVNPIGLDVLNPRFSWQLASDKRNVMQTAYEIRVANSVKSFG
jgi:hypothetical protein